MTSKYRFIVTLATVDREVFPVNFDKLKINAILETDQIFKRQKLSGALIFVNELKTANTDFDYFYAQEQVDQCATFYIRIEKKCAPDEWTVIWRGRFSTGAGKFDLNKCMFEVQPEVFDKYTCLMDYLKTGKELNILYGTHHHTAESVVGTVQTLTHDMTRHHEFGGWIVDFERCRYNDGTTTTTIVCPADFDLWCRVSYEFNTFTDHDGNAVETVREVFKREVLAEPCSGGLCVPPAGAGWNATPLISDCGGSGTCTYWRCAAGDYPFRNLVRVDEVLEMFLTDASCALSYKSIFFNRNPDTADPIYISSTAGGTLNYVTGLATQVNNLMLSQKTDVKYPTASQPAYVGMWTLEKALIDLRKMFRVYWDITDTGVFKLEHVSYYQAQLSTIDVSSTSPQYISFKKKEAYEHLKPQIPKEEVFVWMDNLPNGNQLDFAGKPIIYAPDCANAAEETVTVEDITTDVRMIAIYTDDIDDDGFVMLSCFVNAGDYFVNLETGILSGAPLLNGHLSWTALQNNYFRHDRYLQYGNMNTFDETFIAWKGNVKQTVLELKLCCDDEFDPNHKFATVLGNVYFGGKYGYVESSEYDLKKETLKLNLIYSI